MGALSIYTVHLAFVIACMLSLVNCQTPSLNAGGLYFVDNQTRTMLCHVSSTDDLSPSPLTWEKGGQLMIGRGEGKTSPSPGFYTYSSYLDLPVQASDNGKSITCKYKNQSPGSSWTIYVKKPPDHPTLTGEVNVTWGQTYNWTCTVGGATSLSESDVSLTFSNASTNSSSISSKSSSAMGAYNITTYTVTKVLTLTIPRNSSDFTVSCTVNHDLLAFSLADVLTLTVLYPPVVTVNSVSYTAAIRNTTTLSCLVMAHPSVTSVTWYKDGSLLNRTSGRFQNGDAGQPSLTVANVQREDGGQYTCGASNSLGSTNGSAILLTVVYPPEVTYSRTVFGGNVGTSLTVTCTLDAKPPASNVFWWRINSTDGSKSIISPTASAGRYSGGTTTNPSLTINNLTATDAGLYRCGADNDVGSGEGANVEVQVFYKPVLKVPEFLSGNESQEVTISCDVTALPEVMSLRWKKDGQLLNTTASGRYSGGNVSTPSLTVNSLGAEDVGNYSCVADNSVGSTESARVFLSVQYSPILTVPRTEVGGVEGEAVNLSLSIKANPEVTTLRWYRFNATSSVWSQIDVVNTSKYSGGTAHSPSLIISALDSGDWGDYQAEATNVINTRRSLIIKVAVSYKPTTPNITGNAGSYKEGEAVVLTCTANGFPTPVYDWYRDSIVYQQNASVLNISSASPDDNTQIRCRAVNSLGYSEAAVSIVVQYKPRPSPTLSNTTADIGESVTLSCDVDSNPAPTNYTWFFNGSVVSTGRKTLTVTVTTASVGIYRCIASNSQGDSSPVDIVITQNTATDVPETGQSTEASGLSVATLVLIIIICVIVALVIVLAIVYFCSGSRCTRKKNEIRQAPAPADAPVTFPEVEPGKNRLPPLRAVPPPSTAPPPRGKLSVDDEHLSPSSVPKEESRMSNGLIISMPGGLGGSPRPYRLRPLNIAGAGSGEVEPATDTVDEPPRKTTKKKKKKKRKLQIEEQNLTSEGVSPHQSPDRLLQDDSVDV